MELGWIWAVDERLKNVHLQNKVSEKNILFENDVLCNYRHHSPV